MFKFNNKYIRTTLLKTGKCPLWSQPFQRLFSLLHASFSWERFIFSKIFMDLPIENKGKVIDNYLFNLKLTVSKADFDCTITLSHWFALFPVLPIWFHSMHPPPSLFFCWGELNLQPNFQKGGVWQDRNFKRGVAGKEGSDFFQGGCNFHIKNKLKSEIFNDKFISNNIFLCYN